MSGEVFEGAMVKSVSVENLVNRRNAVYEKVMKAIGDISDAMEIADAANIGFPVVEVKSPGARVRGIYEVRVTASRREQQDLHRVVSASIDSQGWRYLLEESGLKSFMDSEAREKWDKQIAEMEVPPFTAENIRATFTALYDARADMFDRGVINVFHRLSWDYRTNLPHKFGKRIIVGQLKGVGSWSYADSRRCDELDDLTRVFSVLDGKPEPDHRHGIHYLLQTAPRDAREAETEYLHIRWHKNRNGHIRFKRLDLVAKMNAILGKHYPNALPEEIR